MLHQPPTRQTLKETKIQAGRVMGWGGGGGEQRDRLSFIRKESGRKRRGTMRNSSQITSNEECHVGFLYCHMISQHWCMKGKHTDFLCHVELARTWWYSVIDEVSISQSNSSESIRLIFWTLYRGCFALKITKKIWSDYTLLPFFLRSKLKMEPQKRLANTKRRIYRLAIVLPEWNTL